MGGTVTFSEDLEQAAFHAIIAGKLPLTTLKPEELSKLGKVVYESLRVLSKSGPGPYAFKSILVVAADSLGGDRDALRAYLKRVRRAGSGREVDDVLRAVRYRQTLVDVLNECGEQLSQGRFSLDRITGKLTTVDGGGLVPVSDVVKAGVPKPPRGLRFSKLPELSRVSGGLMKMWAIGGEPGVGKSTLAVQLSVLASQRVPVLYYDFENGLDVLVNHLYEALGQDRAKLERVTRRFYVRDSIRTLDADLLSTPAPAVVVIDSIQKLPTRADQRRVGLDHWVHRLEALKKRGYTVVILSELNRDGYQGKGAKVKYAYKETGEIEYSADFAIELRESRKDKDLTELWVVKNRHYPEKGHITNLERVGSWWFREVDEYCQAEE